MKRLNYFLTLFIATFLFALNVNAASGSITASTSTKTAVVGSTFTVTVKVSCSEALGSWQFGISYDSKYISLQSGDTNIAAYGDGSSKTKTYTYKFKAIKSGKASVRVTSPSMVSWNDVNTLFTPSVSNTSVTVKTQAEIEASYSKDNNLKSLTIAGYELSPAFDKNVTEYSVQVPDDVTSINVSAKVNDSTASVRGTGSIDISEGFNKVEVVVTAQNGSTKTYTINVEVKDLTPIEVDLEGKKYTIVKKAELLSSPIGYTPDLMKINDIDVPIFKSELTKFTLIGLKDTEGVIGLYIFDEDNKTYTKYIEIKGAALTLYPVSSDTIPEGFTKTKVNINDVEYEAYENNTVQDLILIYAMNVEDGNTSFYIYDKNESSFVRYNSELYDILIAQYEESKLFIAALIGVSVILLLLSITLASKNSKLKRIAMRITNKSVQVEEKQHEEEKVEANAENVTEETDQEFNDIENRQSKKRKKKNRK